MTRRVLDIMDLVCAPEATDDWEDIDFDDADDEAELGFIEGWIREEREYNAGIVSGVKETEER